LDTNAAKIREVIEDVAATRETVRRFVRPFRWFAVKICYRYTNKYEEVEEL
jgi:hypothetical protein